MVYLILVLIGRRVNVKGVSGVLYQLQRRLSGSFMTFYGALVKKPSDPFL